MKDTASQLSEREANESAMDTEGVRDRGRQVM